MEVELAVTDLEHGIRVGAARHCRVVRHGWNGKVGHKREYSLTDHITGALGECAVSRHFGFPLPSIDAGPQRGGPDVGPFEVCARVERPVFGDVHLFIPTYKARDGLRIVAVSTLFLGASFYDIRGWCTGADVRKAPLRTADPDRPPCYWYPWANLRPIETLEGIS